MRLVWHIAAKDLRRYAPLALLWCVVIVIRAVLPTPLLGGAVADARTFDLWDSVLTLMLALDVCVHCLLVAAVVQEDNVTGTSAWWMTRPVGGGRLLGAKLLALGLLFCVLPVLGLVPVWLGFGFSGGQLAGAVAWCFVTGALITIMALGAAAAAASLPQFLFGSLAVGFALAALASYVNFEVLLGGNRPWGGIQASGRELMAIVILLCPPAMAVNQFLTRRRRSTILLLATGFAVVLLVRFGWMGRILPLTELGLWGYAQPPPAAGTFVRAGELPVREGAELRVGASLTRIVALRREGEQLVMVVEERDALPMRVYWLDAGQVRNGLVGSAHRYELANPAGGGATRLPVGEFDSLLAGAMVTGQRRIEVPDWAEGATLVRLEAPK